VSENNYQPVKIRPQKKHNLPSKHIKKNPSTIFEEEEENSAEDTKKEIDSLIYSS